MNKNYFIFIICICLLLSGCGKINRSNSKDDVSTQTKSIDPKNSYGHVKGEVNNPENISTEGVNLVEKEKLESDITEQDLLDAVYDRYYSQWSEDEMLAAIEERSQYLESCSFYKEVSEYMENVREVRDITNVVEPLYYTDMKYYGSQDFENTPLLMIYLAKNEIYARHGYIFKSEDLNNYFMGQLWYEPTCKAKNFKDSVFNEYEKKNLKLLVDWDAYN